MARGLTHIRRGTASTLKKVNNTRSQVLGNFILKREKRSDSSGGAENKSSLEMRESGITKAIDLGADLGITCQKFAFVLNSNEVLLYSNYILKRFFTWFFAAYWKL